MKAPKKSSVDKGKKPPSGTPRMQYAALPWRLVEEKGVEILLATSRDTKRWVIPKGWPMKGRKPHIVAAIEAQQEAGLHGRIEKTKLGDYRYPKRLESGAAVECLVEVFALQVERQRKKWPEMAQRATYWFPYAVAADQVDEPELREIIRAFGRSIAGRG
jgi:8-oxo-dGTP pyrophosphatase MutT (NUDIX family)